MSNFSRKGKDNGMYRHGLADTRIHKIWVLMHQRTGNPKNPGYKWYGARGIKVCERWDSFENFFEDMHEGYSSNLSIDRIDNDGDYEPRNCRWATARQQCYNKRYPKSKLTAADIQKIRERRDNGEQLKRIAADYGITFQHVSNIARGKRGAAIIASGL